MAISRLGVIGSLALIVLSVCAIAPTLGNQQIASLRLKCTDKASCISDTASRGISEFDIYTAEEVDERMKKQVDALGRKIADLEIQLAKERIKRDLEIQQLTATLAKRLNELPFDVARQNAPYQQLRDRLLKDFEQVFAPRSNP
jgi:hypothetical protein